MTSQTRSGWRKELERRKEEQEALVNERQEAGE